MEPEATTYQDQSDPLEQFKAEANKTGFTNFTQGCYPPRYSPCPSCGYCPHCGRGGYQTYPTYPYPYYPYVTCGTGGYVPQTMTGQIWNGGAFSSSDVPSPMED